jgi:hypothetical protein
MTRFAGAPLHQLIDRGAVSAISWNFSTSDLETNNKRSWAGLRTDLVTRIQLDGMRTR